ncbi:hypothetical protein BGX33_004331 [Mortierella sp. NVP41]|nr:hypothetical protein BGX33_004331 [Mortierella sp. NVP41]
MVKLAISAFMLAQLCILKAHASHYILYRNHLGPMYDYAGICLHAGNGIIMADADTFAHSVQNYGFHKDGWFANVNYKNKEVDVQGWGRYKFQSTKIGLGYAVFDGCWDSSGGDCSSFEAKAKEDCMEALNI